MEKIGQRYEDIAAYFCNFVLSVSDVFVKLDRDIVLRLGEKLLYSFLFGLVSCKGRQIYENDWQREHLKGKVRCIQSVQYAGTESAKRIACSEVVFFDVQGRLLADKKQILYQGIIAFDTRQNKVSEHVYKSDGRLDWRCVYEYDKYYNRIKSVRYSGDGSVDWQDEYKYDAKRRKIASMRYTADGILNWRFVYQYDKNGREVATIRYGGDGSVAGKYLYEYDLQGRKVKERVYKRNKKVAQTEYTYRVGGTEERSYTQTGDLRLKLITKYDSLGRKYLWLVDTYENGQLEERLSVQYDTSGYIVESRSYNERNILEWRHLYQYDAQHNKTAEIKYKGQALQSEWVYEYDEYNKLIATTHYNGIKEVLLRRTYQIKYDASGAMIAWSEYDGQGAVLDSKIYAYEYDKRGNWIKKTTFNTEGVPLEWSERTIVYY